MAHLLTQVQTTLLIIKYLYNTVFFLNCISVVTEVHFHVTKSHAAFFPVKKSLEGNLPVYSIQYIDSSSITQIASKKTNIKLCE